MRLFKQQLTKRYCLGIHSIFAVNSCTEQINDLNIGVLGLTKFSKMLLLQNSKVTKHLKKKLSVVLCSISKTMFLISDVSPECIFGMIARRKLTFT